MVKKMESQTTDEINGQLRRSQHNELKQFAFKVLLGEYCLLKFLFNGQVIKPNIFTDSDNLELGDLCDSEISDHAHVVSARCDDERSIGITSMGSRIVYTYKTYNRMFVDVSGDYDSYLSSFRKKSLNSLNRKIKKAEKTNQVTSTIQDFSKPEEVRSFIEIAKPISTLSYQEAHLGTVFRTDDKWINELEALARKNRFRGYVLYINDKAVAYNYCPVYGDGILLYDLSGYIPESNRYSPGTVLQAHIIKQSFSDTSIRIYDLCEGEGRHKEQFATGSNTCFNAYIFPKDMYHETLVRLHLTLDQASAKIVWLLSHLGVKDKIKTLLRRHG